MDNWKISTAYDLTISDLNDYSNGSPEIMLGYMFNIGGRNNMERDASWYY